MNNLTKAALFLSLVLVSIAVIAGPSIIRDDRIKDTALTPALGRGYTLSTNTFQSKCMADVQITDPSYDFRYRFESIEQNKSSQAGVDVNASVDQLSIPNTPFTFNLKVKLKNHQNKSEFFHHIYVEIDMDTYYASVDEARTRLSESASTMLRNKDIPGFFMSCGTYYIRSLGRNAKFVSIFSYSQESQSRDVAFEATLEAQVKAFTPCPGEGEECGGGGGGGVSAAGGKAGMSAYMKTQSSNKKLTITTNAQGLGKNEGATLISYDLQTFRAAIKDAFISMQNPMTGKVTSMEIVPWVENTDFQSLIELEKQAVPKEGAGGAGGAEQPQQHLLLFQKKHILNLNGEYLAEIERADRNLLNLYYQARLCKQFIEANYAQAYTGAQTQGRVQLHTNYANSKVKSNRHPNDPKSVISLKDLYEKFLKEETVMNMLKAEKQFMYGQGGAKNCIDEMLKSGMFFKSWRDIPSCVQLRGKMSAVGNNVINEYCMPDLLKQPGVLQ